MTNTSLIQRRDLEKASDQDRYRLYFERYGITPEEIARICSKAGFEKVWAAGRTLVEHCRGKTFSIPQKKVSAQISETTLAGLIAEEWDGNYGRHSSNVSGTLLNRYPSELPKLKRGFPDIQVNSTHLFREELGIYAGNLFEAVRQGHEFYASADDLRESICVPLEWNYDAGLMAGIGLAEGAVQRMRLESGPKAIDILLKSKREGASGLHDSICKVLQSAFNFTTNPYSSEDGTASYVSINSSAVATWINNLFPLRQRTYDGEFLAFVGDDVKLGFFAAYIAAKGRYQAGTLMTNSTRKHILEDLHEIAASANLGSTLLGPYQLRARFKDCMSESYRLRIHPHSVITMYEKGMLLNPAHEEQVKKRLHEGRTCIQN